jgi:hypothetical protein
MPSEDKVAMPKVGGRKNRSRTKRGKEKELARFLAYARSIGVDPTYEEFERALKKLVSPKRRARKTRR